jgi:hypothetical protein
MNGGACAPKIPITPNLNLAELANLCRDRIQEILDAAVQASAGSGMKGRLGSGSSAGRSCRMAVAAEFG